MGRESREVWAKRVERWRDSGLTAKEFAAETGLNPGTLTYWKWRLRGAGGVKPEQSAVGGACFVEIAPSAVAAAPSESAEPEPIEVVLHDNLRIRVPARFDAAALGRLLAVLERR